jgi:hypothetical protein
MSEHLVEGMLGKGDKVHDVHCCEYSNHVYVVIRYCTWYRILRCNDWIRPPPVISKTRHPRVFSDICLDLYKYTKRYVEWTKWLKSGEKEI